jgi:hypothetical protein
LVALKMPFPVLTLSFNLGYFPLVLDEVTCSFEELTIGMTLLIQDAMFGRYTGV